MRLLISTVVSLYTSRIVLNVLGVEDFGIYNIVGGVVVLFAFLNEAMVSTTQRFISVEIGRNDKYRISNVLSMSIYIHTLIALAIVILAETIGLWFFRHRLVIPLERSEAAFWVYQLSIFRTALGILRVPFNALVIAHEKFKFYTYWGLVEVVLRLLLVYVLLLKLFDNLIMYGLLVALIGLLALLAYIVYCLKRFSNYSFIRSYDSSLFTEMIAFSSWNLLGGVSRMASMHGVNIVVNIFYGVLLNAAIGIATNVTTAVYQLVTNFQAALNPPIIKSYSSGQTDIFYSLVIRGSKFSVFLLAYIVIPLLLNTEAILNLWLGDVPDFAVTFTRLMLVNLMFDALNGPLSVSVQAAGNIRNYQIVFSAIFLLNLPISYFFLSIGKQPYFIVFVSIATSVLSTVYRLVYLRHRVSLSLRMFLARVLTPLSTVMLSTFYIGYNTKLPIESTTALRTLSSVVFIDLILTLMILVVGLTKSERTYVYKRMLTIKNSET